jgi:Flp pilus assembly protein TadD
VCCRKASELIDDRRFAEAEPLLREALGLQPDDPDIINKLGSALFNQGRTVEAEALFVRANELRPNHGLIINNLGASRWDQGRLDEAIELYQQALSVEPELFDARMNLGVVLSDVGRFDEALEMLRSALEIRPDSSDALQNLGMTFARLGDWGAAFEYYDDALTQRPDYAEVHRNRAYGWLYHGDYERGWAEHEWRLKCRAHPGYEVKRPLWSGQELDGEQIVLHYEQGLGDTLQFIRYAELVAERGGTVIALCQSPVLQLVARCRGVALAFDGTTPYHPDCRLQAPLMSLPFIFRTTVETIPDRVPYLFTDALITERWKKTLFDAIAIERGPGGEIPGGSSTDGAVRPFLIGVAWKGSPAHRMDRWRSFLLAELAPIAALPGVRLVSLQVEHGVEQIAALDGLFPVIELPSRRPRDFFDTAAIVSQLDLVITADTAVAHLAGGLGARVWTALCTLAEWRWMPDRDDSPWYPSMRLFRQTRLGDWPDVFRRMAEALRPELEARAGAARHVA